MPIVGSWSSNHVSAYPIDDEMARHLGASLAPVEFRLLAKSNVIELSAFTTLMKPLHQTSENQLDALNVRRKCIRSHVEKGVLMTHLKGLPPQVLTALVFNDR